LERDILVPAFVEAVQKLPLAFRHLQTADLSGWQGGRADAGFRQLLSGVSHVLALRVEAGECAGRRGDMRAESEPPSRPAWSDAADSTRGPRLPLHRGTTAFSGADELVVSPSRKKLAALAVAAAALVTAGIWALLVYASTANATAIGTATRFFGFCGAYTVWRLVRPTPSLVINREGIFDNASAVGVGLIRWDDISDLREYRFMGQVFLGIHLRDRGAFLARLPPWKRQLLRLNKYLVDAPVNIPQVALPTTIAELLREIAVRFGR